LQQFIACLLSVYQCHPVNNMTSEMPTLQAATLSCFGSFFGLCEKIEQQGIMYGATAAEIDDEFDRFTSWMADNGALAEGHYALDWRLRDDEAVRSVVLSILKDLLWTLEKGM
jgi:hypothetical protein